MLFKGLLGTDMSGAVAGLVASHNKGGAYFRERIVPTNPNSVQQQQVRNQVSALSSIWQQTMTQLQRDAWDVYATNVTVINRLGDPINISGIAHFIRSNVTRAQIGQANQLDAPTEFNLGAFTAPTMVNATAAGQTVDFTFSTGPLSDPWANEAGSFLVVFVSRPQNSGITYFRGPYRFRGSVQGDPVPPVSPLTVSAGFPFIVGQRLFGRAVVIYADGRYTADSFATTVAVA